MRAVVLSKPRHASVIDVEVPEVDADDVLIEVAATGVCGTDVAVFRGDYPVRPPVTMGHEFSGTVAAVGRDVVGLAVGERVLGEGSWETDASDHPDAVERLGRSLDGSFATFVRVPQRAVHRLPDAVSFLEAQSASTVATAIHAADRAGSIENKRVAVVGPGHAGLLLMEVVRDRGPAHLTMLGTRRSRLQMASELGAARVVDVRADGYRAEMQELQGSYDLVFEASGTAQGLAACLELTRFGGTVIVYGIISGDLAGVPGSAFYAKELNVLGSNGGDDDFARALNLLAEDRVHVLPVVTSVLPLDDAPAALTRIADRATEDVRVVFEPAATGAPA